MSLSSLFLLFVGFLSTGSTREELYGNAKSRKGGRSACAIAIVLSYVLTIVWISIIAFTAITVFIYYVFSSLCSSLPSYTESDCVDLGLLKRLTKGFPDANLRLCGADVQQFCAFTTTAFTTIVVAYIGASILLLGLMQFLVCNGANYAHVTNNKRYLELKGVIYSEDGYEKNVLNSGGPVHQKPGFNIETTRRAEDGRQNAPSFAGTQRKRSAENEYYNQYNSFSRKRPY